MSSDTPIQTVLQQRDARPVSGEHLEVLGKKAASDWVMGKFASLHEAVINTVRSEQLSPEQVHRVVEFCNSDAYLQEFRKEGGQHKVVHFDKGPADPAQVLQDLNDGGGGARYDRGTLDYSLPPSTGRKEASYRSQTVLALDKTASAEGEPGAQLPKLVKIPSLPKLAHPQARHEDELWALFGNNEGGKIAFAEPLQPLRELSDKLAGARDQLRGDVDSLEIDFQMATRELYDQVKVASQDGIELGQMLTAWSTVTPDPLYVKVAFSRITPRLRAEGVFNSLDAIGESLLKTAHRSVAAVNPQHPLVATYAVFVDTLNKLANARATMEELAAGAAEAAELLKVGSRGGLVGAVQRGASAVSKGIDKASPAVAGALVGAKDAKHLAPAVAKGLKGTALVGAGLTANAALQNVTDRPAVRGALGAAKSVVPGTMEYQQRRYNNMTGQ